LADKLGVVCLFRPVELSPQMNLELVCEGFELKQLGRLGVLVQEANGRPQDIEIDLDLLQDTGPAHLDDDVAPVFEQSRVDLSDRSARERLLVDARKGIRPELLVDRLANFLKRDGRCGVDELRELFDVGVRKQIRS
jgi:hypothetical protein